MCCKRFKLVLCLLVIFGLSIGVGAADEFREFPLRNGEFRFMGGQKTHPADWSTQVWSGQYEFSLDPPAAGIQNPPTTAVITTVQPGRAAYWQDVQLIKGRYRLSVDMKLTGGCTAVLVVGDANVGVKNSGEFETASVDFNSSGKDRVHLIVSGPGEGRFRRVQIVPLELKTNPAPVENSPYIGEIVLPQNPDPAEEFAAWELQRCIGRLTGRVPGLRGRDKTMPGISILVGGEPNSKLRRLKEDAYRVGRSKNTVILQGRGPRGTLYAVYDFLKLQGCAWGFAGDLGEEIPSVKYIKLPEGNRYENPDYDVRGYFLWPQHMLLKGWWTYPNLEAEMDWALRNRFNALWVWVVRDFGAHRGYSHLQTVNHSWSNFLTDEHPEWWTLVNGKRQKLHESGRYNQLCVSNKELRDAVVQKVLETFEQNPRLKIYALNPEDEPCWWCECENCRKLDADRGKEEWKPASNGTPNISMSDRVINFINEVTARVTKVYPDRQIEVYAYGGYLKAPVREKVHPNVLVKYTYWPRPPLNEKILESKAPRLLEAVEQLDGWKKAGTKNFGLYDYHNWVYPDPVTTEFFQSADMLRTLNKRWSFAHAMGETVASKHSSMMMFNLRGALLWNVNTDYREFIRDMCEKFYGPAAQQMHEYYVALDNVILNSQSWKEPDWHYTKFSDFTLEDCLNLSEILGKAEAVAKGIQPYESRVEIARFGQDSLYYIVARYSKKPLTTQQRQNVKESFDRAKDTMIKYTIGTSTVGIEHLKHFYLPVWVQETVAELPIEWMFRTDPENVGLNEKWFAKPPDQNWQQIRTDKDWTSQGHNYHGAAWYSLDFELSEEVSKKVEENSGRVSLHFGAVDGDADIFLNGEKIGEQKVSAGLMWDKAFTIPLPNKLTPGTRNRLYVRVKKDMYAAGIWKPVSIVIDKKD